MPNFPGMVSDALRMISGGGSDDALGALFSGQQEQFIERATLFERASALQIVEL